MAELGDYAIKLRSMTQGRGSFVSQFERYDEAPVPVQEKVIAENKARMEALNKEKSLHLNRKTGCGSSRFYVMC